MYLGDQEFSDFREISAKYEALAKDYRYIQNYINLGKYYKAKNDKKIEHFVEKKQIVTIYRLLGKVIDFKTKILFAMLNREDIKNRKLE